MVTWIYFAGGEKKREDPRTNDGCLGFLEYYCMWYYTTTTTWRFSWENVNRYRAGVIAGGESEEYAVVKSTVILSSLIRSAPSRQRSVFVFVSSGEEQTPPKMCRSDSKTKMAFFKICDQQIP